VCYTYLKDLPKGRGVGNIGKRQHSISSSTWRGGHSSRAVGTPKNGYIRWVLPFSAAAVTILALLNVWAPRLASAGSLADLNLANRVEQSLNVTDEIANPHDMSCDECHEVTGQGRFLEYMVGDDTVKLCRRCHEPTHVHPVGVKATDDPEKLSRIWLPLGNGAFWGKIVCLTCHYVHSDRFRRHLLRGDTEVTRNRQEYLCSACHSNRLITKSPHDPKSKSCPLCHTSIPKKGQSITKILDPNVQERCNFCHGALDNGHFLSVNPFADPDVTWRFEKMGIPLLGGRFTCISCHDPHSARNRKKKMLRNSYLTIAARSDHVNPHWKEVMCISCHTGIPENGKRKLRFGGDINQLCDRCHNGKFARRDVHPVGVIPSAKVDIPPDMPLSDGKLSCDTCHDPSLQEGGEHFGSARKENPKFLRGGFGARAEFCFRCHSPAKFGQMNAHIQLDNQGNALNQVCLFCHASPPDTKVLGIENVGFDTDSLDEFCTCCHRDDYLSENHPRGPHLVEPSEVVSEAIKTAVDRIGVELPLYRNRITCATCHNPHEKGVIQIQEAAKGTENAFRLRLADSFQLCRGCHVDK